tara:strand:+ start:127 stop:369 length:243 start_codon:yes stop_codon:yes gene_type:complete
MSDKLKDRLRAEAYEAAKQNEPHKALTEAADRIERLEKERGIVLQNKRVNDAIQTAFERGELTISLGGWLAAIDKELSNG